MPIHLNAATKFQTIAQSGVDAYVTWSRNSLPYAFFGMPDSEIVEQLEQSLVANGFTGWDTWYHNHSYHCNDGRKEGGGFTGIICYFGTMPCMLTLRFFLDKIAADVWQLEEDRGIRPGARLFYLEVDNEMVVETESFLGNLLHK